MTKLRITIGLPGAGKSTDALAWVSRDPTNRCRINRDNLREMMHGGYLGTRDQEEQVTDVRDAAITKQLRKGRSVVADDTNLRWGHVVRLQHIAARVRVGFEVISYLDLPFDTCVTRDAMRERSVGRDTIKSMWMNALRNQIETWRSSIVDDLIADGHTNVPSMIDMAIVDPLASSNAEVVRLARQYTDNKITELAPSTTRLMFRKIA